MLEADGEQTLSHGQADAFGLGGAGELGLPVRIKDHAIALLFLELLLGQSQTLLEVVDLFTKLLYFLLDGRAIDGFADGLGFAVNGLTRDAALLRLLRDGAAGAEEGAGSTGKVLERAYDGHRRG